MEEILNKNIFDDKELLKYSPDYSSQAVYLRMEARRETVRDSCNNLEFIRCGGSPKKNIIKAKGTHKLKKEIVKLRAHFQNLNLRNQIDTQSTRSIKPKAKTIRQYKGIDNYNNENKIIEDEMAFYISKSAEDEKSLLIENDREFKLLPKEPPNNNTEENILNNNLIDGRINESKINSYCTANQMNCIKSPQNERIENKVDMIHNDDLTNEYKNDLQSLLIMMTINSTIDENMESVQDMTVKFELDIDSNNDDNKMTKDVENLQVNSEKSETIELINLLNITSLRKEISYKEKYIARKVIEKWKSFVSLKKENQFLDQRQKTLNNFFDKLSKKVHKTANQPTKKAKLLARDYETYQHRYKIQKHIIALQKAKLEEQNKMIEQLKYNKIIEASKQSLDTMREDVRKTYYEIDKHLKPKIKCLSNELKIKEFEEPSLVLHCLKVPQFLQRMEARAREREEKHAIIRERRKQMEEERVRLKQQAELAQAEMDKEEKIRRIKELREKRKKEKVENIRKKQHAERLRALIVMADLHYERNLMNKYGIRPLKLLIEIKRDNMEKAKEHYKFQLMKNIVLHWMWHTEDMVFERQYKAEDFCRKKILKRVFTILKKNHYNYTLKKQVAEDYYDLYLTQLVFRKFKDAVAVTKKEFQVKWINSTLYYNSNILFKTFTCWRSLPALNALKREQDARKLKWREKVLLVVPDYRPPED